jgi:hypothetical protein
VGEGLSEREGQTVAYCRQRGSNTKLTQTITTECDGIRHCDAPEGISRSASAVDRGCRSSDIGDSAGVKGKKGGMGQAIHTMA